jgi:hypothetical protein
VGVSSMVYTLPPLNTRVYKEHAHV